MTRRPTFLVSESETQEARESRRSMTGRSSGETFADLLRRLVPDADFELVQTVEPGPNGRPSREIEAYDAVVLAGSPLHVYEPSPEVRRQVDFMRAVYASGTPSFGSCAGLQIAVAAAGGVVRRNERAHEIAFARRITPTEVGRRHFLMAGRPAVYDALAIHSDEVATLPDDATLLATSRSTTVQAVVIEQDGGTFWGVQYHPEMPVEEIAQALRRQTADMLTHGFVETEQDAESYADMVEALGRSPDRRDLAWRLGIDEQILEPALRQTEIRNFIDHLVMPVRAERGRG